MFVSRLSTDILLLKQKIQSTLITKPGPFPLYVYTAKFANVSGALKSDKYGVDVLNNTKWLHLGGLNIGSLRVNAPICQRNIHSSNALFNQNTGSNQQKEKLKNLILMGVIVFITLVILIFENVIHKNYDIVPVEQK